MKRHAHTPKSYPTDEVVVSDLTTVELLWLEKRIENRVRFGRAVSESIMDSNRRILSFAPGSIFAFVRWTSNDFGTVLSRIDILRAVIPGQSYSTVPWIRPGGVEPVATIRLAKGRTGSAIDRCRRGARH